MPLWARVAPLPPTLYAPHCGLCRRSALSNGIQPLWGVFCRCFRPRADTQCNATGAFRQAQAHGRSEVFPLCQFSMNRSFWRIVNFMQV